MKHFHFLLFSILFLFMISSSLTVIGQDKKASTKKPIKITTDTKNANGPKALNFRPQQDKVLKPGEIPLEDFFRNAKKRDYQISPDGTYFSWLAPYKSRMNIYVQKIGDTTAQRVTNATKENVPGYFWANDNRLLYIQDDGGNEDYKLYAIDRSGENLLNLTPFDSVTTRFIDDLKDFPNDIIVGLNKRNQQIFDPYRINIKTGDIEMIAENPGNISDWYTDHDGVIRAAKTTDGVNNTLLYRATDKDEFTPVLTINFKESLNPLFFTFDNKHLYASSNLGRDKSAIVKYDIATGKEMEILFEHPEVDVSSMRFSRKRKVLTHINYTTDKRGRHYLDKEMEDLYTSLEKQLEGYEVSISDYNKDEDKFLVRTYSDRSRGAYYFYDLKKKDLQKLADVSPWIDESKMAEMKPIKYKSRDGLTIHGYLTLPPNKKVAKYLPVVINPHGGPWARDNWGYNPEVQFLANRGFAVLQMNFRGSTGFGRDFWEASFKEWGGKMQDDVTDGVNWLIEQGIADPNRIAIYGASYGGFATLSGITKTPDLYTCAIDYVGVSNIFTFYESFPPYWKPYLEMVYEMVGNPNDPTDSLLLRKVSPVFHVDKIKVPLLVAQGANDPRVKKAESDQIVEALRNKGVNVRYIVKDDEGHGFSKEENRFEFYREMERFLRRHMSGPRG